MDSWPEDLSMNTLQEVIGFEALNQASSKGVRVRTRAMVNSKLAGEISRDEYLLRRTLARNDTAECKRRRKLLLSELANRRYRC